MSPLLWKPESWPSRLEELEARTGDLKEAPLRRDVRSLGMLLGEVLREQAGERLFRLEEDLRQLSIERREAASQCDATCAAQLLKQQMVRVAELDLPDAYQLTRAFAYYFELINLAETNHRKRRRTSMQMSTEGGAQDNARGTGDAVQRGSFRGTLRATGDILRDQFHFLVRAGFDSFEVKKPADARVFAEVVGRFSVYYQPDADGRTSALRRRLQSRAKMPSTRETV